MRGIIFFGVLALTALPGLAQDRPQLRVLTYNIHHGEGTDGKFDLPRLARIIGPCWSSWNTAVECAAARWGRRRSLSETRSYNPHNARD